MFKIIHPLLTLIGNWYFITLVTGSTAVHNSFFGRASGLVYMTRVGCSGTESRLTECFYSALALAACGDGDYAGVRCIGRNVDSVYHNVAYHCVPESCNEGSIRLRGRGSFGGRIEICVDLTWTTICNKVWDNRDASVACRQLGFSPYGTFWIYIESCIMASYWWIHRGLCCIWWVYWRTALFWNNWNSLHWFWREPNFLCSQ